jgi:hypothetical protein
MSFDTVSIRDELKLRIPALNSYQIARPEIWTERPPDNYAIFREGVRPYIFSLLRSPGNEHKLQEIFSFLEEVARADNAALSDVLQLEIATPLSQNKAERKSAWKYMGSNLKNLVRKSEKQSFTLWLARLLSRSWKR